MGGMTHTQTRTGSAWRDRSEHGNRGSRAERRQRMGTAVLYCVGRFNSKQVPCGAQAPGEEALAPTYSHPLHPPHHPVIHTT